MFIKSQLMCQFNVKTKILIHKKWRTKLNQIKITVDSPADIPENLAKKLYIKIIPLYVNTKQGSYKDMIDITPNDIFNQYETTKVLPKTSACTIEDYINAFKNIIDNGDKVIHINIGSKFSSCYQNALIASKEFSEGDVYVIDSKNLSSGMALCVLTANELIKQGETINNISNKISTDIVPNIETSFIIENLTYLHAGGRCSSVAKFGANLLKIKPCIDLENGEMNSGKKYRGPFSKCVDEYINDRLSNRNDINKEVIFITHSPCNKEIIDQIKAKLKKQYNFKKVIEAQTSCTISSHCGPNTVGVIFLRNKIDK